MRLRKPLSILLSLSMIAGMSAFASNAAVTSDESVQQAIITMQIILKAMQAKRITNRDSVQCTAKPPQHGKPGHLMRHL